MTVDQQEQQILTLVHKLPILRRIRLALTILQKVEPSQIPVDTPSITTQIPKDQMRIADEELAAKLINRKQSYQEGKGENISRKDLMTRIYTELSNES